MQLFHYPQKPRHSSWLFKTRWVVYWHFYSWIALIIHILPQENKQRNKLNPIIPPLPRQLTQGTALPFQSWTLRPKYVNLFSLHSDLKIMSCSSFGLRRRCCASWDVSLFRRVNRLRGSLRTKEDLTGPNTAPQGLSQEHVDVRFNLKKIKLKRSGMKLGLQGIVTQASLIQSRGV